MDPANYLFLTGTNQRMILNSGLQNTKGACSETLTNYINSRIWQSFEAGFIIQGKKVAATDIFSFHLCPPKSVNRAVFSEKKFRVKICANLVESPEDLETQLTYYNTKLYDLVKQGSSKPTCEQRLCTEIRALHLSGACPTKGGQKCFEEKVKVEAFGRLEECKSQNPHIYDLIFTECFEDRMPLTNVLSHRRHQPPKP